jgi:membrane protein YdbS with pleckstrin-like domain
MDMSREIDAPPVPPAPQRRFSDDDEHDIEKIMEAHRRLRQEESATAVLSTAADETSTRPIETFTDVYKRRRKHITSFIVKAWKRVGEGLIAIIILWLLVSFVPSHYFNIQFGSNRSLLVGLVAVALTILIIVIVLLAEIQAFMRWKNWKIEVTETHVNISQRKSILGRLDSMNESLPRASVQFVEVKRKWYLSFLNAYTVTFDAPSESDQDFHDLPYIKDGAVLNRMFGNGEN